MNRRDVVAFVSLVSSGPAHQIPLPLVQFHVLSFPAALSENPVHSHSPPLFLSPIPDSFLELLAFGGRLKH